jgi:hypothetical protein
LESLNRKLYHGEIPVCADGRRCYSSHSIIPRVTQAGTERGCAGAGLDAKVAFCFIGSHIRFGLI